jgi:hypothetical protein
VSSSDPRRRGNRRDQPAADVHQADRPLKMPAPLGGLIDDIDEILPMRDEPLRTRPLSTLSGSESARPSAKPPRTAPRPEPSPAVKQRATEAPPAPSRRTPGAAVPQRSSASAPVPAADTSAQPEGRLPVRRTRPRPTDLSAEIDFLTAEPYRPAPAFPLQAVIAPWQVALVALISILILGGAVVLSDSGGIASNFSSEASVQSNARVGLFSADGAIPRPAGDYHFQSAPSLTAVQIDQILASYGSPAVGTGIYWHELGIRYNIDPAFGIAFFIHESSAGTNPNWAGFKPDGSTTHNVGNIICAGYPTCYGRFRDYDSWATGIEDWYRLIDREYIQDRGVTTLSEIIPIYAPAVENDVQGYINTVAAMIDDWRVNGVD